MTVRTNHMNSLPEAVPATSEVHYNRAEVIVLALVFAMPVMLALVLLVRSAPIKLLIATFYVVAFMLTLSTMIAARHQRDAARRLSREGETAIARVRDKWTEPSDHGHTYWLTYEIRDRYKVKAEVDYDTYFNYDINDFVTVILLPDNPEISRPLWHITW